MRTGQTASSSTAAAVLSAAPASETNPRRLRIKNIGLETTEIGDETVSSGTGYQLDPGDELPLVITTPDQEVWSVAGISPTTLSWIET